MSLISCPDCGSQISSEASFCPHCDFGSAKTKKTPIYVAKSRVGRLEIYQNKVVLKNWGENRIEIFIQSITGVEFKRGNIISPGFIQIKSKGMATGGPTWLLIRQQRVGFTNSSRSKFEEAKNIIEEMVSKYYQESPGTPSNSITKELQELHDLKTKGIITEEEYSNLKKRIIRN